MFLRFTPGQPYLGLFHVGKFLYRVTARIVEEDRDGRVRQDNLPGLNVPVGDMFKGHASILPVPAGLGGFRSYFNAKNFFTARNGDWVETLRNSHETEKLVLAMRVIGRFTTLKSEKPLCEIIDPDFPRQPNGDIDGDFRAPHSKLPPLRITDTLAASPTEAIWSSDSRLRGPFSLSMVSLNR